MATYRKQDDRRRERRTALGRNDLERFRPPGQVVMTDLIAHWLAANSCRWAGMKALERRAFVRRAWLDQLFWEGVNVAEGRIVVPVLPERSEKPR